MSPPRRTPATSDALRASLIAHAQRLISREGASALTMRALAAEAGCALGLPYKVFADRHDLVVQILHAEFTQLRAAQQELADRAGTRTVATNLAWFADLLLDSPAVALVQEVVADEGLSKAVAAQVHETGVGPGDFESVFAGYLAGEKRARRVAPDVDENALGFFVAGAVHNLIVAGDAWPKPTRRRLKRHLAALAAAIAPQP